MFASRSEEKAFSASLLVVCGLVLLQAFLWVPTLSQAETEINPNSVVIMSQSSYDTTHRGRAPEPSTMALMASGAMAGLVRFARRRFAEFKRCFDLLVSVVGLILSSPLWIPAMIIVKLTSPGSVIYRQTRVGRGGRLFEIYKLRTMVQDAEKQTGAVWAQANDSRVTPFGKFLRLSRIDEIPQFINILKGDMSLIGPRPERPEFVDKLTLEIADYQKRLSVRPGITGLAQIKQSYDSTIADVRKKVKYDLLYIKRMCFLTDLRIIVGTVGVVLTGRGAR